MEFVTFPELIIFERWFSSGWKHSIFVRDLEQIQLELSQTLENQDYYLEDNGGVCAKEAYCTPRKRKKSRMPS